MEQYWYGVLDHDGVREDVFMKFKRQVTNFKNLKNILSAQKNKYDALLVKSYDNVWGHDIKRHAQNYNYENHLYSFYKANCDLNINTAVSNGKI